MRGEGLPSAMGAERLLAVRLLSLKLRTTRGVKVRGITAARMGRSDPPGVGWGCGGLMAGSYS